MLLFYVSMKLVILAAGKGTRMGDLTIDKPKPLVPFKNKTILFFILFFLKKVELINEIILVVDERNLELFDSYIKSLNYPKKINIISQEKELKGTYAALYSAREFLVNEPEFLVTNGDDIHSPDTFESVLQKPGYVLGVQNVPFKKGYYNVVSIDGIFDKFESNNSNHVTILASGLYKLKKDFLDLKPTKIQGSEFGIPQTLVQVKEHEPIHVVFSKDSIFINTKEDLDNAEIKLKIDSI